MRPCCKFLKSVTVCAIGLAVCLTAAPVSAAVLLFSDNFDTGASAAWGNERGNWRDTGGVYDAGNPDNAPITYSSVSTLTGLTDFRFTVDVNEVDDGGVWLRSDFNGGAINGVLLVTGGNLGTADTLYWHTVVNGAFSGPLNTAVIGGLQTSDISLTIDVVGDTYSAFVNGSAVAETTLNTGLFASGSAGLYDFSPVSGATTPRGQTFDNVTISDLAVPEPPAALLLAVGLAGVFLSRQARRSVNRRI